MNYRQRRKLECQKLFEGFYPDLSKALDPKIVLRTFELARDGYYSREIAERIGKTPKAIQKIFRRYDFPKLHNYAPPLREERQGWQGGVKIVKGYAYARVPWHPFASKHGKYVAVHRLAVEAHLGRYLLREEVVHHKDDNPANNSIDNLKVYKNNGEHLADTRKGKCPKWSEEGKKRISLALSKRRRLDKEKKAAANRKK